MPAGALRSVLQDFLQDAGSRHARPTHHGAERCSAADGLCSVPLPRGVGRHARAVSFLDSEAACVQRPTTVRTAFHRLKGVSEAEVDEELVRQENNEQEILAGIEKKVDDKLHNLEASTERKVDDFFKTMREAYGVPFGAPLRRPGAAAPAASHAGEGAKIKFKLPDLPPGKHAVIQLERQQPVAAGGEVAGTQKEALSMLQQRLDKLMRKVAGQPREDQAEREALHTGQHGAEPPGSLGDLLHKLNVIRDNLSGDHRDDRASETMSPQMPQPVATELVAANLSGTEQQHSQEVELGANVDGQATINEAGPEDDIEAARD